MRRGGEVENDAVHAVRDVDDFLLDAGGLERHLAGGVGPDQAMDFDRIGGLDVVEPGIGRAKHRDRPERRVGIDGDRLAEHRQGPGDEVDGGNGTFDLGADAYFCRHQVAVVFNLDVLADFQFRRGDGAIDLLLARADRLVVDAHAVDDQAAKSGDGARHCRIAEQDGGRHDRRRRVPGGAATAATGGQDGRGACGAEQGEGQGQILHAVSKRVIWLSRVRQLYIAAWK